MKVHFAAFVVPLALVLCNASAMEILSNAEMLSIKGSYYQDCLDSEEWCNTITDTCIPEPLTFTCAGACAKCNTSFNVKHCKCVEYESYCADYANDEICWPDPPWEEAEKLIADCKNFPRCNRCKDNWTYFGTCRRKGCIKSKTP